MDMPNSEQCIKNICYNFSIIEESVHSQVVARSYSKMKKLKKNNREGFHVT